MIRNLSILALVCSIVSSSINIFPLILLSWTFNLLLFIFIFLRRRYLRFESSIVLLGLFCFFYLLYAFLIGVDIFNAELFRRELKFFIPFSNCFFLSQLDYGKNKSTIIINSFYALIFMNIIFLFAALLYLSLEIPLQELYPYSNNMWENYGDGYSVLYTGLFSSHTAFGGWLGTSIILTLSVLIFDNKKSSKKIFFLLSLIIFLIALLFLSKSRAYSVGIIFVIGIFLYKDFFKKLIMKNAIILSLAGAIIFGGYSVTQQVQSIDVENIEMDWTESTAEVNVSIRFVLWAIAINNFIQSPIIGVGATRYDDDPLVLMTFPEISSEERSSFESPSFNESLISRINVGEFQIHTDQHAHNLFLNVIAETGLLGLMLLLIVIAKIFKKLREFSKICNSIEDNIVIKFTYYSFILLLCASMFGNNFLGLIPGYLIFSIYGYLLSIFHKTNQ